MDRDLDGKALAHRRSSAQIFPLRPSGGRGRGPLRSNGRVRWVSASALESPTSPQPSPPPAPTLPSPASGGGLGRGPSPPPGAERELLAAQDDQHAPHPARPRGGAALLRRRAVARGHALHTP